MMSAPANTKNLFPSIHSKVHFRTMMSTPVNIKKLSNSMNYVLPEGDLELFPTLIQWIDSCNGFIYGSVMMRYIAKIVNSVPRDIDIAFINIMDNHSNHMHSVRSLTIILQSKP
jgi:hypothetical protein